MESRFVKEKKQEVRARQKERNMNKKATQTAHTAFIRDHLKHSFNTLP